VALNTTGERVELCAGDTTSQAAVACGAFSLSLAYQSVGGRARPGVYDGHDGVRADGDEQRELGHGDGRSNGHRQRPGVVERGGQHVHGADGHGDGGRPEVDPEPDEGGGR